MKTLNQLPASKFVKSQGEILIAYLSEKGLRLANYWETLRIGHKQKNGKYPVFIQKLEAIDKGWKVV